MGLREKHCGEETEMSKRGEGMEMSSVDGAKEEAVGGMGMACVCAGDGKVSRRSRTQSKTRAGTEEQLQGATEAEKKPPM